MRPISEQFIEISEQIEKRKTLQAVEKQLAQLRQDCAIAAAQATSEEARESFVQVQQALETWHRVWPKLGTQPEFRLAVAREARLWSNRLAAFHHPVSA